MEGQRFNSNNQGLKVRVVPRSSPLTFPVKNNTPLPQVIILNKVPQNRSMKKFKVGEIGIAAISQLSVGKVKEMDMVIKNEN